jgi:hypothetical protein
MGQSETRRSSNSGVKWPVVPRDCRRGVAFANPFRGAVALLLVASMIACGGTTSTRNIVIPPPPPCAGSSASAPAAARTAVGYAAPQVLAALSPQYFGMHVDVGVLNTPPAYPWPSFPFGTVRMTSTETKWSQIDLGPGNPVPYDFSTLDQWLGLYKANGNPQVPQVIYTIYSVPTYASSNPTDPCAFSSSSDHTPGSCDPPTDVDTTDATFTNFITALALHAAGTGPGQIHYWEMWNEPNNFSLWNGTFAQLVRMSQDARCVIKGTDCNPLTPYTSKGIDPTAQILTPTPVTTTDQTNTTLNSPSGWMDAYLKAGGGPYADILSFHGYVEPGNPVEGVFDIAQSFATTAVSDGEGGKPIWDTELGYATSDVCDPDLQAGWLARTYLLQPGLGVERVAWFEYGATNFGTLYLSGSLNAAGKAYGVLYGWLVGATPTGPCTSSGTVWKCDFTLSGGVQAQAVWDASQSCSKGTCTSSNFPPDSVYTKYEDLQGNSHSITSGSTVSIGAEPVFLKSQ